MDLDLHESPPTDPTEIWDAPPRRRSRGVVVGVFALLACWGVVAMAVNADGVSDAGSDRDVSSSYDSDTTRSYGSSRSGSSSLPLGPIGEASCRSAVAQAKSHVPDAIAEAQRGVDEMVAENPELAAYASEAKRMLAQSAPDAYASLDDAGDQLGC